MRRRLFRSFQGRLFLALLAATLIPLLACSAFLLQTFRLRLTEDAAARAQEDLGQVLACLDQVYAGFDRAVQTLEGHPVITTALSQEGGMAATSVYSQLFSATAEVRDYARFDLYDAAGVWRYSTQDPPSQERLPTGWGALGAADRAQGLTFIATQAVTDSNAPLLQAVAPLRNQNGRQVGYLVASMYQSHLRQLLEGKYGSQNDLILLSGYWRPVYCAQPSLAAALAPRLRSLLLSGQGLEGASEEFIYSVAAHPDTGLYAVLRQPQVFTRDTMGLLYTVSATIALICVALSVVLSLGLSRQLSLPVSRLTQAMGHVEQDDLDVQVVPAGEDELGRLARRFNDMVSALKRNRAELVENQRELTQAQIRMLQAQLNPHFLCNTLDTMKWISKINKVPQVAEMSASLADILRYAISPDELVPLWQDEEILERYVDLQSVRLSGGFTFFMDMPEELADCLVPKLLLQPIVENAILHGLDGVEHGGVTVKVREEQGKLVIVVADNGRGLPEELVGPYSAPQRVGSHHLGLYNVHTILQKFYGPGFGLTLANRPSGGAVVTAVLPIQREEASSC